MPKVPNLSVEFNNTNLDRLVRLNYLAKSIYESNPLNPTLSIMDITNSEVQAFLKSLHDNKVKYMLVGGIATVYHGHVRTTQDLDLWVQETPQNKTRLVKALKAANVAGADNYLTVPMIPGYSTITIGEKGFVADFMGYTKAFKKEDFDLCYKNAKHGQFDGTPITVIHMNDLIKEKQTMKRPKDLDDVINLKRIKKSRDKDQGF
jgi:predicted nucleotidyltransferase